MAPEQFTGGGEVTPKTDVWSLGVMIFKMLTGTSAFHAPSMFETAEKVVRGPTPSLSEHRPELHPAWSALIEGALRKDPAERLSLEELLRAVKQAERLEAAANPESPDPGGETASLVVAPVPAVSDGATHTAVITSTGGSYSARFGSSSSPSSPWAVRHGERRSPTVPPAAARARRMTRRKAAIGGAVAALVGIGAFAATYFDPFEVRAHDAPPAHAAPAPPVVAESAEVVEAVPVPVVPLTARPVATPGSSAGAVAEASSVVAPVRAEHARAPSLATSRPRPPTPTAPTAEVVSPARPAPVAEPRPAKPKPLTNER
jgi:serine/threonine-protein kinase